MAKRIIPATIAGASKNTGTKAKRTGFCATGNLTLPNPKNRGSAIPS
jgi:hypothetical protein